MDEPGAAFAVYALIVVAFVAVAYAMYDPGLRTAVPVRQLPFALAAVVAAYVIAAVLVRSASNADIINFQYTARLVRDGHYIYSAPLPPGSGSREFRAAFTQVVLPALHEFQPQLLMISAGFDAHRLDPLADLNLDADDYAWATSELVDIAQKFAFGRIVSSLEGGYSLTALRGSTTAHVAALMG